MHEIRSPLRIIELVLISWYAPECATIALCFSAKARKSGSLYPMTTQSRGEVLIVLSRPVEKAARPARSGREFSRTLRRYARDADAPAYGCDRQSPGECAAAPG